MCVRAVTDYTSAEMRWFYGFLEVREKTTETGRSPPATAYSRQATVGTLSDRYRKTPERGISEVLSRMREGGENGRDGS